MKESAAEEEAAHVRAEERDSRAFRLGLRDTAFFEVDKQGLFDVKEPLVAGVPLQLRRANGLKMATNK